MLELDIPIYEDVSNWVFLLVHSSYGIFIVALVGTLFNKYIVVFKASPHNLM